MSTKRQKKAPPETKRVRIRIPLRTAGEVSKFMAKRIKLAVAGEDENKQYKLVTMAAMLGKSLADAELETRLRRVEKKLGLRGGSDGEDDRRTPAARGSAGEKARA